VAGTSIDISQVLSQGGSVQTGIGYGGAANDINLVAGTSIKSDNGVSLICGRGTIGGKAGNIKICAGLAPGDSITVNSIGAYGGLGTESNGIDGGIVAAANLINVTGSIQSGVYAGDSVAAGSVTFITYPNGPTSPVLVKVMPNGQSN